MTLSNAFDSFTTRLTPDPLGSLLNRIVDHEQWWRPDVRFRQDRRWWKRLVSSDDVDVWLISWLKDQSTEFHDHGASRAAYAVVQGELTETRVRRRGAPVDRTLRAGARVHVSPHGIHAVRNDLHLPAISIHAYSPPLRRMTYYDVGDRGGAIPAYSEISTGRDDW